MRDCGEPLVSLVEAADAAKVEVEFAATPHVRAAAFVPAPRGSGPGLPCCSTGDGRSWLDHAGRRRISHARDAEIPCAGILHLRRVLERVLWELGDIPPPDLMFRRVSALIAACPKVGTHMSGSAIDISVIERDSRHDSPRGGAYLEMSELTPMDSPFIAADARENRAAITTLMARHGFVTYPLGVLALQGRAFRRESPPASSGGMSASLQPTFDGRRALQNRE